MKIKNLVGAAVLGLLAAPAFAVPLDAVSGFTIWKLGGYTTEANLNAGSTESTWGIGGVTSLTYDGVNPAWQSGSVTDGNEYLYYIIYGIADQGTSAGPPNGVNIYNIGATGGDGDGKIHVDIYRTSTLFSFTGAQDTNRCGFACYTGVTTTGSLYLSLELVPGVVAADDPGAPGDNTQATLYQNVNSNLLPASGFGDFYAEVVGGSAETKWDTNGYVAGTADFSGHFTLNVNPAYLQNPTGNLFPGLIQDPILSTALPEPTSLALLGLGLAGLALRRRKVA